MKKIFKIDFSYLKNQIKGNWKDWRWYYFQFTNHILSKYYLLKRNKGIYVCNEEWDNLIILDACRFDIFEKMIKRFNVKGTLEKRISRGSSTPEFLRENFSDKFNDIVYVTANPFVYMMLENPFFETINVWKDGWSDEKGTVEPDVMLNATIKAKRKFPDKRLITHFMQPHNPFIGPYSREGNFWQIALKYGKEEVMKAYESNFEFILPYIKDLVNELDGLTVITTDHGNACGETVTPFRIPIYGHPNGVHIPALVEIPWFIVEEK